jgi:hypothetical protein
MADGAVFVPYNDCHAALRRFGLGGWRWGEGGRKRRLSWISPQQCEKLHSQSYTTLLPSARHPDQPFALITIPKARSIFDIVSIPSPFPLEYFVEKNWYLVLYRYRKIWRTDTRNGKGSAVGAYYSSCPRDRILFGFSTSKILTNSQLTSPATCFLKQPLRNYSRLFI